MQTTNDSNLNNKLSAIDKALAAAKARKAMKTGDDSETQPSAPAAQLKQKAEKVAKAPREAKTAARAAREAEREQNRQKRSQERTARRAARAAEKSSAKPAHMKKVETAGSKLPKLDDKSTLTFNEITTNYDAATIATLALHLQHFNRVMATKRALTQRVEVGQQVRIVGGDPKYIGKTATITIARRIRCWADVPGFAKPGYFFTSDVELVESSMKATGTRG